VAVKGVEEEKGFAKRGGCGGALFIAGGGGWQRQRELRRSGGGGGAVGTAKRRPPLSKHGQHGRRRCLDRAADGLAQRFWIFSNLSKTSSSLKIKMGVLSCSKNS
jgi:hypothetical protein